jgi:hypothetical protein
MEEVYLARGETSMEAGTTLLEVVGTRVPAGRWALERDRGKAVKAATMAAMSWRRAGRGAVEIGMIVIGASNSARVMRRL